MHYWQNIHQCFRQSHGYITRLQWALELIAQRVRFLGRCETTHPAQMFCLAMDNGSSSGIWVDVHWNNRRASSRAWLMPSLKNRHNVIILSNPHAQSTPLEKAGESMSAIGAGQTGLTHNNKYVPHNNYILEINFICFYILSKGTFLFSPFPCQYSPFKPKSDEAVLVTAGN